MRLLLIVLSLSLINLTVAIAQPLTPDQFLQSYNEDARLYRHYNGNILATLGVSMMAGGVFMDDESGKEEFLTVGAVYTVSGLLLKTIPGGIERLITKSLNDPEISSLNTVDELRKGQRSLRYIFAGLFTIPLFLDFDYTNSSLESSSANAAFKAISVGVISGSLLFKTPLEQRCEKILAHYSPNLGVELNPGLTESTVSLTYSF